MKKLANSTKLRDNTENICEFYRKHVAFGILIFFLLVVWMFLFYTSFSDFFFYLGQELCGLVRKMDRVEK